VPAGASLDNIRIEFTNIVTRVTGSVANAAGERTREAFIIVFASDQERWGFPSRYILTAMPAPDLAYSVALPPGDFLVVALPGDTDRNLWNDPDFLSLLRGQSTAFTIAEGETKTVDLKLLEAPIR
jgi:hypothetical protein